MGIFHSILAELGLTTEEKKERPPEVVMANVPAPPAPAGPVTPTATQAGRVDVSAKLDALAATHSEKLDWRASIVDLLKLLGLESNFGARQELAMELGCPADKMSDSAQMNTWLHKTVLQKLSQNGGNIPPELL